MTERGREKERKRRRGPTQRGGARRRQACPYQQHIQQHQSQQQQHQQRAPLLLLPARGSEPQAGQAPAAAAEPEKISGVLLPTKVAEVAAGAPSWASSVDSRRAPMAGWRPSVDISMLREGEEEREEDCDRRPLLGQVDEVRQLSEG